MVGLTNNTFEDDMVQVFGLWTLNKYSVKSGKIFSNEIAGAKVFFAENDKFRIIASHHPLNELPDFKSVMDLKPHIILSGHEHQSAVRALGPEQSTPLLVASGTSTSSRTRLEANTFNLIKVIGEKAEISLYGYGEETQKFERIKGDSYAVTY